MSQQPDLTIPFDASVVDEDALRALRAVQRAIPTGDGGASGNLMGGTEAVAAFGMMPGAPSGDAAAGPHEIAALAAGHMPRQVDASFTMPEILPGSSVAEAMGGALPELSASTPVVSPLSVGTRRVLARGSSSASSSTTGAAFAIEAVAAGPERPDDPVTAVASPSADEPEAEEVTDTLADSPLVHAVDAQGQEDQPIVLDLTAALADTDGSESLTIKIFGVPEGASLTRGTRQPDGSWDLSPADILDLALIPPRNYSGTLTLTLRATSHEANGETAAVETSIQVQVHAVADAPLVKVADAHGQEDASVTLAGLGGALRDIDGSESLGFILSGVPVGATLSVGTPLGGGRWSLTPSQLEGLTLMPPPQFSGRFTLTLTAVATESEAGVPSAQTSATFTVSLDPVDDAGRIGGSSQGPEDTAILLQPNFTTPDADGSETWSAFTQVAGLPPGATLTHGTEIAPGTWQVSTADLRDGFVMIQPAEHSDTDFTLTLTATLTDSGNGKTVSRIVTGTHTVTVSAVADAPVVSTANVSGDEDKPIPLKLSADLVDADGSEILSVSILNVPDGAELSHGARQADGSWKVSPAELADLTITPPTNFSGTIHLTFQATARETSNGSTAIRSATFQVQVDNVSDDPVVDVHNVSGLEDGWIPLKLSADLTDKDGSENLLISILDVPAGARLSHGELQDDGSWKVPLAKLDDVSIQPPKNFSGTIDLTLRATAVSMNGATAVTDAAFRVQVEAVADVPDVSVKNASGDEDQAIALDLSAALTDTDRSEVLSVTIEGLPAGAQLSAGSHDGKGNWTLTGEQLKGLTITPPADWSGTMELTLVAEAREVSNGSKEIVRAPFTVEVEEVADAPLIVAPGARGNEDTDIPLGLSAVLKDQDGSELLSVTIFGVPPEASLSHGVRQPDDSWVVSPAEVPLLKLTPKKDFSGPVDLRIEATATESNGDVEVSKAAFRVQVVAVADKPDVTVANFSGREDEPVELKGLGGELKDLDGSESLSFLLAVPPGATLNAGTPQRDGQWLLTKEQLSGLVMTPPPHGSGRYELTLTAVATEKSGGPSAYNPAKFTVDLDPVVDAGTITGSAAGDEDTWITLHPNFSSPDSSETWSEFTFISGVPSDAKLNCGALEDGVWKVPTAALRAGEVSILPPPHSNDEIDLRFTATLSDSANGKTDSRVVTGINVVTVNAVADTPDVTAENVKGKEDVEIPLNLTAKLVDGDGSETLTVIIHGVPKEASLTHGDRQSDGSWIVDAKDLPDLALNPPRDFSGTIDLKIEAIAQENSTGKTATEIIDFQVEVEAVADAPGLRVSPAVGDEDTDIPLSMTAWITDQDGSETIIGFRISGIPDGAELRAGDVVFEIIDGSVLVDPALVSKLTIKPPAHSDDKFTLKVVAISAEPNRHEAESEPKEIEVTVRAVADAPEMTVTGATGDEDTKIPLNLTATLPDSDESEVLSFVISGIPQGAILSHGTYEGTYDGLERWSLTAEEAKAVTLLPPPNFAGSIPLSVVAVSQEVRGGDQAKTRVDFKVDVVAVVDDPAVGGLDGNAANWGEMQGTEDRPIELRLNPGLNDDTEKVVGNIFIRGVPEGAVLQLKDGKVVSADDDGIYTIKASDMSGVTLTMPRDSDKAETLTIEMVIEDTGGVRKTIKGTMEVDPAGDADPPRVTLTDTSGTSPDSSDALDGLIPLNISAISGDRDDSETLYVWIRDVPAGATLSAGIPAGPLSNGKMLWLVPAEDLQGLSIRPPAHFSGTIELTVTVLAIEDEGDRTDHTEKVRIVVTAPGGDGGTGGDGGSGGDGSGTVPGPGAPEAQTPTLTVEHADGFEDRGIGLKIEADMNDDGKGDETLGIRIDGVPENARLSAGIKDPLTGSWVLSPDQLEGLTIIPPPDFSGTIELEVIAVSTEATGHQATQSAKLSVHVDAVADSASTRANPPAGEEDETIALNLSVTATDRDHSETVISVVISGVPEDARLEGTGVTKIGNGKWSVDPSHLEDLRFVPPPNADGTYKLTVTAITQEANHHSTRETEGTIVVSVAPKGDAPTVTVQDASGVEDGTINLLLSAELTDSDTSEVLSLVIQGLPEGAILSKGINNGDGSWTLKPSQLAGLTVTPPADWSGTMDLTLVAHSRESTNGSVATTRASFQVKVDAAADMPVVSARDAVGKEDEPIALNLSAISTDRDGSEVLSVVISGMPDGAVLSHGVFQSEDRWIVPASQLSQLTITAPPNFSGSFELTLHATTREENGAVATTKTTFRVQVNALADAPEVTVADFTGTEDTSVRLTGLGGELRDDDGSEILSFVLSGLPDDASLNAGIRQGDGSWLLTPGELDGLIFNPPPQASGQFTLTLTGVSVEKTGGLSASTSKNFTISLDPVLDLGTIEGASTGDEGAAIVLKPVFAVEDDDGSETWSEFTEVSGLPIGAYLNSGVELRQGTWRVATAELQAGSVRITPPAHSDTDFNLTYTATLTDSGNGKSVERVVTGTHMVVVDAVADEPLLTAGDVQGTEDRAVLLDLSADLADKDGSETLSVSILGIPEGFTFSHGTSRGSGEWLVSADGLTDLQLTPPANFSGTLNLTLQATSMESTGQTASMSKPFTVTFEAVNDAPELVLTAPGHAKAGDDQADAILLAKASDVDSVELEGATITLSAGQTGDRLDFEHLVLHDDNGRVMIGDTGIEVVGGGYNAATNTLTLSGNASPATYSSVLEDLVLANDDADGLAAGTRSIGVTLRDSAEAISMEKSVDVIVEEVSVLERGGHEGDAMAQSATVQDMAGAEILFLMADGGVDPGSGGMATWTVQVQGDGASGMEPNSVVDLHQPIPEPIQPIDDFQADTARPHWS